MIDDMSETTNNKRGKLLKPFSAGANMLAALLLCCITLHHATTYNNGLPVVVIECKSPKVKDAIPEAIDQLLRYSEQRGAKGEGNAPLL